DEPCSTAPSSVSTVRRGRNQVIAPYALHCGISALPLADLRPSWVVLRSAARHRNTPASADSKADVHRLIAPALGGAFSLDYFVDNQQKFTGQCQSECLGSLEVDDEFVLGRLFDRQIGRFGALENLCHIGRAVPERLGADCPIGHQTTIPCDVGQRV